MRLVIEENNENISENDLTLLKGCCANSANVERFFLCLIT